MDNPFAYRELTQTLKNELELRAGNRSRRNAPLNGSGIEGGMGYRITSMCKQCKEEYQLNTQTNKIIFNNSTGKVTYPKVYGISIKKQGELGTTKKCTIMITCYSESQLYELQNCYFIPGMSVRVEIFAIDAPPVPYDKTLSNNEAILEMSKWTDTESANYEGLQGVVTNFSYNFEASGVELVWVCSVEVVSASASALNHPTYTPCINIDDKAGPKGTVGQQCETLATDKEDGKRFEIRSALYNHFKLLNSVNEDFLDNPDYLKKIKESIDSYGAARKYFGKVFDPFTQVIRDQIFDPYRRLQYRGKKRRKTILRGIAEFFDNNGVDIASEYYITWGRLELLINELVYNGASKTFDTLNRKTMLNSEGVMLPWLDNYISADPRVCVLPNGKWQEYLFDLSTVDAARQWISAKKYVEGGIVTNTDGTKLLYLQHVLLNVIMLQDILDEVESEGGDGLISTFLQKVLDQITVATGGVWELLVTATPVTLPTKEVDGKTVDALTNEDQKKIYINAYAHITVMEMKSAGIKSPTPYEIPSNQLNESGSVIIKLDFKMKMTEAMKTQAVYSKIPLSNNKCAAAAHTAFNLKNNFTNLADGSPLNKELEPCKPCENNFDGEKPATSYAQWMLDFKNGRKAWESRYLFEGLINPNIIPPIIEDTTVNSLLKAYSGALNGAAYSGDTSICRGQPLPFTLQITTHGIGGFKFGQLITTKLIPQTIRDVYYYQVTAVEHDISNKGGWITTINTVPKTKFTGVVATGSFDLSKDSRLPTSITLKTPAGASDTIATQVAGVQQNMILKIRELQRKGVIIKQERNDDPYTADPRDKQKQILYKPIFQKDPPPTK